MPSKTVAVGSAVGLHARPAAVISEAVVNAGVPVTLALAGGGAGVQSDGRTDGDCHTGH